ncbi:MAG: hypothetical protein AB8G05_05460 [Oligoflexales bacterium]
MVYFSRVLLYTIVILFSGTSLGAYIRYGGFSIENIQFQKKKFKTDTNKKLKKNDPSNCIGIMEISPYLDKKVFYSQEEFVFLIRNKPAIAKHFSKKLGINSLDFSHYLMKGSSRQDSCISLEDFAGYIGAKPNPSIKAVRILRKIRDKGQAYFALIKGGSHEEVFSWSGYVFDQFIIRDYSDALEDSEKDWNGGYSYTSIIQENNIDRVLKIAQRFISFYESLGRLEKSRGNTSSSSMNFKKNHPIIDFMRFARDEVSNKSLSSQLVLVEKLKYPNSLNRSYSWSEKQLVTLLVQGGKANQKEDFLHSLAAFEKKNRKKMEKMHVIHRNNMTKIPNKINGISRTMGEYMILLKKIDSGVGTKKEKRRFQELRSEIEFGIRPNEKSKPGKIRHSIKKFLRFYSYYGTDTIVDKYMDYSFNLNIRQMQPMGKKRYLAYRLAKGGDGFFVLTTSILGATLIPFTGGLSLLVANVVNVGTTGFFSVLTSFTRNEPVDSHFYRLSMRSIHTFIEGFVPIWTEFNGFFTAIDDLRVATSIDQHLSNWFRRKSAVIKVRPESLGRPFILSLLRERYNFVAFGLLPKAKFLYLCGSYNKDQEQFFKSTLKSLTNAKVYLAKSLQKSAMRYEYLLDYGKVPDHMIYDVSRHLKHYQHYETKYRTRPYSSENILKAVISGQGSI